MRPHLALVAETIIDTFAPVLRSGSYQSPVALLPGGSIENRSHILLEVLAGSISQPTVRPFRRPSGAPTFAPS
jgi:hypothetical protein